MNLFERWKDRDQLSNEMPDYSNNAAKNNGKTGGDQQYNFVIYLIFGVCFLFGGLFVPMEGENSQQTMLILGIIFILFSLAMKAAAARNMSVMQFVMTLSLRNLRGKNNTPTKKKKK